MITKLLEKKYLTSDVIEFVFSKPENFNPKPGQYVNLVLDKIARAYSLSEISQNKFTLTIEIVPNGKMSEKLKILQVGTEINFAGPIGKFTLDNISKTSDLVFIATGSGIAPMKCIIDKIEFKLERKVFLFQGLRYEKDVYYKNYFESVANLNPNFSYELWLSKAENIERYNFGHVQNGLDKLEFQKLNLPHFFICGSKEAVLSLTEYLKSRNISQEFIHFERFN